MSIDNVENQCNSESSSGSGSIDFSELEKDIMINLAEYENKQWKAGQSIDDIETRLIEIIAMATGDRINLSR